MANLVTSVVRPDPRHRPIRSSVCFAILVLLGTGCSYHYVAGPLVPVADQGKNMTVADDGGVTYERGRLEVRMRPVTDDELNRQFAEQSDDGTESTNPYTYGNTEFPDGKDRSRFTVFHLKVKNYAYPKVVIDPAQVQVIAANGRNYWRLNPQQLETYYRSYITGYRGNEYSRYQERINVLQRTLFKADPIFSGQEADGFIVLPVLHQDVDSVSVVIHDATLRFDVRGEPVESIDITYGFEREIGKADWRTPESAFH